MKLGLIMGGAGLIVWIVALLVVGNFCSWYFVALPGGVCLLTSLLLSLVGFIGVLAGIFILIIRFARYVWNHEGAGYGKNEG